MVKSFLLWLASFSNSETFELSFRKSFMLQFYKWIRVSKFDIFP